MQRHKVMFRVPDDSDCPGEQGQPDCPALTPEQEAAITDNRDLRGHPRPAD